MADKWGHPFLYVSDVENSFMWELKDDPNADSFFRPDEEVEDNGDGSYSFASTEGLRPSLVRDTTWDRIGCDVPQSQFASRGYGWKESTDFRDIEFKMLVKLTGGTTDKFLSPEMVTGRHSEEPCNEGSSYGFNFDYNSTPLRVRPFKEQGHSDYTHLEWITRPDILNAKVAGLGRFIGIGITRFNKTDEQGKVSVVIEAWINPDPAANPLNWLKWVSVEDKGGWGDSGAVFGALNADQILHWAMPAAFRVKVQDANLGLDFKEWSLRRISPFATTVPDQPTQTSFGFSELQIRRHINTERFSACTVGGGGVATLYNQLSQNGDTDLVGSSYQSYEKIFSVNSVLYNHIITGGRVYLRKTGAVVNDTFLEIRKASDNYNTPIALATIAAASISTSSAGDETNGIDFAAGGNSYRMQVGDIFTIRHTGTGSIYVSVFRDSNSTYDGTNTKRGTCNVPPDCSDASTNGDVKMKLTGII